MLPSFGCAQLSVMYSNGGLEKYRGKIGDNGGRLSPSALGSTYRATSDTPCVCSGLTRKNSGCSLARANQDVPEVGRPWRSRVTPSSLRFVGVERKHLNQRKYVREGDRFLYMGLSSFQFSRKWLSRGITTLLPGPAS